MPALFSNNASATLAASITSVQTSLTLTTGQGALFPAVSGSDYFYATIANSSNTIEIVKVTARSADVLTVVRAQEGTTASAFSSGGKVELRLTAAALNNMAQLDEVQTFSAAQTFSGTVALSGGGSLSGSFSGTATFSGNITFSNTITGSISGNANTVTNGVYTTGTQSIAGDKTFSGNTTFSAQVTISSNAPLLNFAETDQTLPAGRRRMVLDGNVWSLRRNTAAAGDYSTEAYDVTVSATGDLTTLGNITAYSDARLKTDLTRISDALDRVRSLTGYTYTRTDTGERQTGLLAQDVQAVLPEAVIDGQHLSLAYGNLAGLLVEAIKDLDARVQKLGDGK